MTNLKIILFFFLMSPFVYSQQEIQCQTELIKEQIDLNNDTRSIRESISSANNLDEEAIYVPLAIHIVRGTYGQDGLTEDELNLAMLDLNAKFKQAGFEFEACIINYIENDRVLYPKMRLSYKKDSPEYQMVEPNLKEGYINIFFLPSITGCGWSSFPGFLNLEHPKDWTVMANHCAINGSTLAHEIGHYFSLYHTHQGKYNFGGIEAEELVSRVAGIANCGPNVGDELCDTPAEPIENKNGGSGVSGCVDENCLHTCNDTDAKGEKYIPDTHNLMSYSQKQCRDFFSPEQIERMKISYMVDRSYLLKECVEPITQPCQERDLLALVALYNATDGANWKDPWDLEKPITEWRGLHFNENNCVRALNLPSSNLKGNIPPEIGNLLDLENLHLSYNPLLGASIPEEIGKLRLLKHLNLSTTNIEGNIPDAIGFLLNLETVRLGNTKLNGKIPTSIKYLKKLNRLELHNNKLVGDIPEEIIFTNLIRLPNITDNQMSGCYKPNLVELCTKEQNNIGNIYVSNGNSFDATWEEFCATEKGMCTDGSRMTDSLALVAVYQALNGPNWRGYNWNGPMDFWHGITLNNNGRVAGLTLQNIKGIEGTLPPEIGNLTYLKTLKFYLVNVSGPIPKEIGKLSNLEYLEFGRVSLDGTSLPPEMGNLQKLRTLVILDTGVTGSIPSTFDKLANLTTLNLTANNLGGELLPGFANLTRLNSVRICGNKFEGCFDPAFKNWCSWASEAPNCIDSNEDWETNKFDATWEEFCNQSLGECTNNVIDHKSGDFNNDGVVNHNDVLYLGLAYGNTGPACDSDQEDLESCVDWQSDVNGVNGKYQDGNRNGIADKNDLELIRTNYESTDSLRNPSNPLPSNYRFSLEKVSETPVKLVYDLYVKNTLQENISTYGLACNVDLSKFFASEVQVDFSESSLEPDLFISRYNPFNNVLDIALTRTDRRNRMSIGPIAQIIILVKEIDVDENYSIDIYDGSTTFASGLESGIGDASFDVISDRFEKIKQSNNALKILQNPLSFANTLAVEFQIAEPYQNGTIEIFDLKGLRVKSISTDNNAVGVAKINTAAMNAGMYICTLAVDGNTLETEKIILRK